jgi:hypothetical protein
MRAFNILGAHAYNPQPIYKIQPGFVPTPLKLLTAPLVVDYADFILKQGGFVSLIDVTYTNQYNSAIKNALMPSFAANEAEAHKLKNITSKYKFPPGAAVGFGIELHGSLGPVASKLLLATHQWTKDNNPYSFNPNALSFAYRTISIELCKTNSTIADCCRYFTRRNNPPPTATTPSST